MADLKDTIRLTTVADLAGLAALIEQYKALGVTVGGIATVSRAVTEQIKRDHLEKTNSLKLVTAQLIAEDKVNQQVANSSTSNSKVKIANINLEIAQRKNFLNSLTSEENLSRQITFSAIANSNAKRAAANADIAVTNAGTAAIRQQTAANQQNISVINTGTATIRQGTAATQQGTVNIQQQTAATRQGIATTQQGTATIQQNIATVRLSTEQLRNYNQELRNKALETAKAEKANNGFGNSLSALSGLRNQVMGLFGAMSFGSFAKDVIDAQSQIQAFDLSMNNLLTKKYGEKLSEDLKRFTLETPLNFEQVIKSSNQLVGSFKAAGVANKEIGEQIPIVLESLGNSASALGGGDRLGRLTYAFSQVQAAGRLMGTEVRQIAETGFPLLAIMSQQSGMSVQNLRKEISDGNVSFDDFKKSILSAGLQGGVFAGSMDIMANTVRGRLDKLDETFFFIKARIGEFFEDSARGAVNFADSLLKSFFGTDEAIKRTISTVEVAIKTWAIYKGLMTAIAVVEYAKLVMEGRKILALEAEAAAEFTVLQQKRALIIARGLDVAAIDAELVAMAELTTEQQASAIITRQMLTTLRADYIARGLDVTAIDAQLSAMVALATEQQASVIVRQEELVILRAETLARGLDVAAIDAELLSMATLAAEKQATIAIDIEQLTIFRATLVARGLDVTAITAQIEGLTALAASQTAARGAAVGFNATLAASMGPAVLLTAAIAALVYTYQKVSEAIEASNKVNYEWVKSNDSQIQSVRESNVRMNIAAESVIKLKEGTDLHKQALDDLVKAYPKYFSQLDKEKNINLQIKAIYDEVNKAIDLKISLMAREKIQEEATNRAVEARRKLIEKGVNVTTIPEFDKTSSFFTWGNERILLRQYGEALTDLSKNEQGLSDARNKMFTSEYAALNKSLQAKKILQYDYLVQRENLMVKYNIKTEASTIRHNTVEEEAEKAIASKKYKLNADNAEQKEIFNEIVRTKALKKTKDHELSILKLEYEYDKSKIESATGAAIIKTDKLEVLENKYRERTAEITSKWNTKADNTAKSFEEKSLQLKEQTAKEKEVFDEIVNVKKLEKTRLHETAILDMEYYYNLSRIKNSVGSQTKKNAEMAELNKKWIEKSAELDQKWTTEEKKAQEDRNKSFNDLEKSKYELSEKLRMLQLILTAKTSDEIANIEEEANTNIIKSNKENAEEQVKIEENKLKEIALLNGEGTAEYVKQDTKVLESKKKLSDASIKLADFETNEKKKNIKEQEKLDEDNAKETIKLEEDKYKLMDKLRILQAISKAKNSNEVIKIQNKENEEILRESEKLIEKQILAEKMKLAKMEILKKQDTAEYKTQQAVIIKLEEEITALKIKLAEFLTDKLKEEIDKRTQKEKDAFEFSLKTINAFLDALNSSLDDSMSNTTDIVTKAQLENKKAVVNIAKQGISAISSITESILKQDYFSAALTGISFLYNTIKTLGQNTERENAAMLAKATKELEDYLSIVEKGVDKLMSRLNDIREAYGDIKLDSGGTIGTTLSDDLGLDMALERLWNFSSSVKDLSNYMINMQNIDFSNTFGLNNLYNTSENSLRLLIEMSGRSVDELIQAEITRGQQIQKTYEIAVGKENELYAKTKESIDKTYQDKIKSIGDIYNEEVESINKKYDYESIKSSQKYNKETLDITAAGSAQLEALITNETSLASVREEFANKRLKIEQAFPLASKAITADMSQAEIDAINASIKARDEQLAKLQGWYNDELTLIANSEGQKRKEYSATETIQKTIRENLELAAIAFAGREIEREKQKNIDIEAEAAKKKKREDDAKVIKEKDELTAKGLHDAALLALETQKNADIATSFKILTELLKVYAEDITKAMEDSAAKGTEAYRKLGNELDAVNELLKQIKANSTTLPLNIAVGTNQSINGFEKGTDNTSVSLSGATVDSRGGKMAILHPSEAVFSKANMDEMTRFMGKRPSRDEVIERFNMGTKMIDSSSFIQKVSPYVISKTDANYNTDVRDLTRKIEGLTKEVAKRQQPVVYLDKNGVRAYMTSINSQIEIKNQKFGR